MSGRYGHSDKEHAFRVFYETGSISETARQIRKTHPKISKATIAKWANEKDARGKTWVDRRTEIQAAHHDRVDDQLATDRKEILSNAQRFRDRLIEQLPVLDAKTLEGATFAFTSLSKFILEQSGADRDSEQTARDAVQSLILALKDDAEIGDMLERKWPEIEKRFYEHLGRIQQAGKK